MANIRATKNGVWSDNTVWSPTPPTSVDDVFASGFTIYVDTNIQVISINTIGATGIGGGGVFVPNNGVTMRTNVVAGSSTCVNFLSASPNSFTLVGNISGGTFSNQVGVRNNTTGTINISGNVIGGPGPTTFNGTHGINNASTGVVNIVGNVEAGFTNVGGFNSGTLNLTGISMGSILYNGGFSSGIQNNTNGICNIVGGVMGGTNTGNYGVDNGTNARTTIIGNVSAFAGTNSHGVLNGTGVILNVIGNVYAGQGIGAFGINNGTSTTNLTGNCYAHGHLPLNIRYTINGSGSNGINNTTGTVNILGNVFGSPLRGDAWGISHTGSGTVTVFGNAFGGNVTDADAIRNTTTLTGPIILSGTAYGGRGTAAYGVRNLSTVNSIVRVKRAAGNDWGLGYTLALGAAPGVLGGQNNSTFVEELECGPRGQWPTGGIIYFTPNSKAVSVFETDTFQNYSLIQSNSADNLLPPVSSVRQSTVYNLGLNTGTCIIPSVSSVAAGALVDSLSGTAVLTPQTTWNYPTTASDVNSMGGRLRNALNANSAENLINSFSP